MNSSSQPPATIPDLDLERPGVVRIDAAALADATLGVVPSGAILLHIHPDRVVEVLAVGEPAALEAPDLPPPDRRISLPAHLLMPGLVNAHTHLDLTHIGPVPHDPAEGFVRWVEHIRANRRDTPDGITDSVRLGVDLSLAGGTVAVGDIAGAPKARLTVTPALVLGSSRLAGISFLEFFGIGRSAAAAVEQLERFSRETLPGLRSELERTPVRVGLQPHAPNTVDLGVYRWAAALAARHDLPLSTHLAETPEERALIAEAAGPQRAMLESFGLWDETVLHHIGRGYHPVAHLARLLRDHRILCAHVNDATDEAIGVLADTRTPVVYCPRASAYFGADTHFGPHRYRDMLAAGVKVCLGTDSIINLDTPERISILDEIRLLHHRDGTDARTLLRMGTVHGAKALGLNTDAVTLRPGPLAGLLAVPVSGSDSWVSAMGGNQAPMVLFVSRESF